MAITVPGFVVVVFVLWYSLGVWRSTDRYFRDEYKNHLKKEYEKNKYLKEEEINKLISEKKGSDGSVRDGIKSDTEVKSAQIKKESENKVTDKSEEPSEIGNQYDNKQVDHSKKTSEDWEDDNIPRVHDNVCYADKDEFCKITIAQQSTDETLNHDYTDEELCSMQSGSVDYCLP